MSTTTDNDASVTHAQDALGSDLGWALGVVFRAYVRMADQVLEEVPGGARGFQVLSSAARSVGTVCPGSGQGTIAKRLGVDRTVMTYLVDDLESAGLVERHPDPADRRQRMLVVTAKGRGALRRLTERLDHVENHALGPLDATERTALRAMLARLAEQAQAEDPVGDHCELAQLVKP